MGVISVGASLGVRPARASGLSSPSTSEPAAVDRCARRSCASSKPTTTASTRAVPSDRPKPLKRREPCASSGSAAARRGTPERSRPRRASSDTPASVMSRGSSQPLKKSKTLPRVQGMDVPRDGPHSVDGTSGIHLHQAVNVRPSSDAVRDSTTVTRDEAMEIEARDVADAHTTRSDTGTTERVESDVDDAGRGVSVVRQLPAGGCSYNNNSSSSESHSTGMIHVQLLVSGKNEERGEARTSICSSRDALQYDARGVAWGITIEDRMLHETYNQQKDDEKRATVCQGGNRRWRGMQADTTTLSPQRQLKCRQEGDFATKEAEEWKSRSVSCGVGEGDTAREKDEKRCLQEKSTILQRRLARSVKISRLLEAEVKLARAHEVLERHKCLQLRRRYEELRHRKKVVELVVKRQCNAMTAALSTTSSSKRKQHMLESERLNVAHNAYPFTTSGIHDSMLRERDGKAKRVNAGKVRTLGLHSTRAGLAKKKDLAHLVKKVQAVESLLTSGLLPRSTIGDPDAMQMQNITAHEEDVLDSADVVECADERLNMDTSNANEIVIDVSTGEPAVSSRKQSEEKRNDRRDVFRSTRDLPFPGLTRDLNLIQDYTLETDCKLLRFLAGKRQYFYLEPLMTGSAYSIEEKQWLLSAHDIQILHRFLLDNANFGNEVVVYAERLRALGNLVPPLSTSPSRNSLSGELGVFGSSRHKEWSELQNKIVNLHSLALIAHMLGKHYLSRHAVCGNRRKNDVIFDDILGEDTLKSDLFTYILRPIRSSAIESSLFDSLPISLVRETIEHCPEVVNHVLQWKSKNDVPEYLRKIDPCNPLVHGVTSATVSEQVHPGNSYFLRNLLLRLTTYARDLDAAIKALVATLKEKIPTCQKDRANYASLRRERIIAHVNLLTSVTAHVVAENTKLQLHKWWVLFFEHSCAWFNPGGVDEVDDRSYDKFTCLQDALYIWHNKALLYTTQDDFVDCKHPGELALDQHEGSAVNGEYCRSSGSLSYGSMPTGANISLSLRDEDEAALLQSTPASMRDAVQNRPFSREDAKQCMMTSRSVEKARCELEESLARTRDSMNELGRAGPWRTHVKDFNALTRELAKQFAIQKKLVKSQWARHYTKYNEFYLPLATKDASLDRRDADMALLAGTGSQAQDKLIAEDGANAAASIGIDWTNVYDPDKDAPDVIEVKKLRHEITLAKEQLLREIDGESRNRPCVSLRPSLLDRNKKALFEECKGLAASCMYALGKLMGNEEVGETLMTPVKKKQLRSATKPARPEKRLSPARREGMTTRTSNRRHVRGSKKVSTRALKSTSGSRSRRSESVRVAKALAASNAGFLPSLVRPKVSSSRVMSVRSIGGIRDQRSEGCPPLRMGCSGCRDLRRRCTGCCGCCLHCVCVSCGCRMCCSARLSSVQKTMAYILDVVESNEACKWKSNASAGIEGHYCGMLSSCQQCYRCDDHCMCLLTGSVTMLTDGSSIAASVTANAIPSATHCLPGFNISRNNTRADTSSSASCPNQQLFRGDIRAAQHRDTNVLMDTIHDNSKSASDRGDSTDLSSTCGAVPSRYLHGRLGPLPTFDYGIDGAFGLGPFDQRGQYRTWRPAPLDKNEQEDLFRAARVRMKLVRSTFAKRMGLASGSGCLDGEQLWQPDRIQMMWERRDFHGVLGLPRDAPVQQIKRQYRKLALKLHPDKASDTSVSLESTVAEAGRRVGVGSSGERVDAFVAATQSYKILLGDVDSVHGLG